MRIVEGYTEDTKDGLRIGGKLTRLDVPTLTFNDSQSVMHMVLRRLKALDANEVEITVKAKGQKR